MGHNLTATTTARSALNCLSYSLAEAQQQEHSLRINPEALRDMARGNCMSARRDWKAATKYDPGLSEQDSHKEQENHDR